MSDNELTDVLIGEAIERKLAVVGDSHHAGEFERLEMPAHIVRCQVDDVRQVIHGKLIIPQRDDEAKPVGVRQRSEHRDDGSNKLAADSFSRRQ